MSPGGNQLKCIQPITNRNVNSECEDTIFPATGLELTAQKAKFGYGKKLRMQK